MTGEHLSELIELATRARVYDLARPLSADTPVTAAHPPFRSALQRRHGDVIRSDGGSSASELLSLGGHTGTHIDALCHAARAGRLHGGLDAHESSRGGRFRDLGIDAAGVFICRGVLLDVARAFGLDALPPAAAVTADSLREACTRQGVEIRSGDAVLIRTGWPSRGLNAAAFEGLDSGVPGADESAARLLGELAVAVTGSDTLAYERIAPGDAYRHLPVHLILLVDVGIHIIELLDLERLAADGVWEFLFVALPLRIVGGTGSPLRPVALVAGDAETARR